MYGEPYIVQRFVTDPHPPLYPRLVGALDGPHLPVHWVALTVLHPAALTILPPEHLPTRRSPAFACHCSQRDIEACPSRPSTHEPLMTISASDGFDGEDVFAIIARIWW